MRVKMTIGCGIGVGGNSIWTVGSRGCSTTVGSLSFGLALLCRLGFDGDRAGGRHGGTKDELRLSLAIEAYN